MRVARSPECGYAWRRQSDSIQATVTGSDATVFGPSGAAKDRDHPSRDTLRCLEHRGVTGLGGAAAVGADRGH